MVTEKLRTRENVFCVLEHVTHNFGGDKPHGAKCPWWETHRSKDCVCGRFEIHEFSNVVTNAGDRHYAEGYSITAQGSGSFTNAFDTMTLATAVASNWDDKTTDSGDLTTAASSGTKSIDTGATNYPIVNDPDGNNPGITQGVDTITWRATFETGEANGDLVGVCIHVSGASFGGSNADPLLMSADITLTKTSASSLKVYVNHNFLGV